MVATEDVLITDVGVPEDASGNVDGGTVEEATTEVDVPEVDAVGVVVDPSVGAIAEGGVSDGEFVEIESFDDASAVVDGRSAAKEDSGETTASEDECSSSSDNASASSLA